jgi:GNAT superfamily N-acetyltransferase
MPDARIKSITPDDVPAVVELIYDLAEYERLRELCHISTDQLHAALFGPAPALFGLVAVGGEAQDAVVGYALYFLNFSTWEGVHGIYLEDLYVRPDQRGSGLGRALLTTLAGVANEYGYARVEWSVLDWNAPSIAFYRSLGAEPMDGWTVFRLTGPALKRAAEIG